MLPLYRVLAGAALLLALARGVDSTAQIDTTGALVTIGRAEVNQACDTLTIDGTASPEVPFVRVQMSLHDNPLVLLIDAIVPVSGGRFMAEAIEFTDLDTASLLVMLTGWDGSRYITPLTGYGVRSLYCSDDANPTYQTRVPGLRFMRTTRQQWTNSAVLVEDECIISGTVPEGEIFPDTLMEGQPPETTFTITLHQAENGLLYRLDWRRNRIPMFDDGGQWYGIRQHPRTETTDTFNLYFTSMTTYAGTVLLQHPSGCAWIFDWYGERAG
jgi:hypothetical protein